MFTHIKTPEIVELSAKVTNGKRWYTTPTGIKYPSVTTILGAKEKPYLEEWRQSLGPKKADKETKRCADRGTAVHKICEDYLNNVENPSKGYEQLNVKLFNQIKFRLGNIDNIRAQEVPLWSDTLKIAGRVDVVAEYNGVLSIIDFKTSNNNKTEDMVEDYFIQCTAYALMYEELFGEFIEDIVVLIAVEKGIMPLLFKRKIDAYVGPLVDRINMFYKKEQGKS
jgi:genome maintenance exonuclease 1